MKKFAFATAALLVTMTMAAQTLNVTVGNVTYQFPAAQAGDMTYNDGQTLTIMGKTFTISDISSMSVDNTQVTNNLVSIAYSGTSATVTVAGNVAQYVEPAISGAYVTIEQSNTADVDEDEITYQLSGTSSDGQLNLSGSYRCTVSLAGVNLTCATGPAINVNNKKRIQISAKNGTENTLTDCSGGSQKACIYSKGQIQLQGNGSLNVAGNTKHAIKSGDYISVKNLTLNISSAVGDGISCNKYFQMKSGTVTISGIGDDGIQCDLEEDNEQTGETTDHEDENSGNVYIEGGTLTVTVPSTVTAGKCVKAAGDITVSGGTTKLYANGAIDLTDTTDPSYTAGFKADGNFTQSGGDVTVSVTGGAGRGIGCSGTFTTTEDSNGTLTITNSGATSSASSYFCTAKGIKAGVVAINGGTIDINMSGAASKGIKADSEDGSGNMTITGGTVTVKCTGAGATDQTEKDGKGCAGLNADGNMTISGGTMTLTSTGTGGKGIKADGVLTVSGGTVNATASGSNYSSGSYSASAKAIKAGVKTGTSSGRTSNYTYSGGIVIKGGTIVATASSHEAIESKNTIDISGGDVYAQSKDDAINSASTFNITGGFVMGYSTGNDGLDANGNMTISGGVVYAIGTSSPEVAIDANTEGGYKLTISGGVIFACGPLENGSTFTQSCYSASSINKNVWYSLTNGSNTYCFKTPSSLSVSTLVVSASSQPTLKSGVTVSGGTSCLNGMGNYGGTVNGGSSVSLSTYSGGNSGGGPGGGPGGGGRWW